MPRAPSGSPTSDSSAKRRSKAGKPTSIDGKGEEGPRRVALACVSCRTRKIRCPAQQPECAVCKQDGRTCSYVRVTAAENAAARAKKHTSKMVKAARLAQDPSASPSASADSAASPTSSRGNGRPDHYGAPDFAHDDTPAYLRHQASWPLPAHTFGAPAPEAQPAFPLNLPSLGPSYNQPSFPPFASHSLPATSAPLTGEWNLPTDLNSVVSPSTSEPTPSHALLGSSASGAYPLPSFFSLPPQAPSPATTQAPSTGMFSYSSAAGYAVPPYQSYLSPPLQPYSAPLATDYDPKGTAAGAETADINNPRSAAYVDQSAASPFGASQTGSEAESWTSSHISSHAHSSTSTSSGPFGANHLRHSSQTSLSDACSPFLPAHYLPQGVRLGQQQQQQQQDHAGSAYGGLGLELNRGYPGQPFGTHDQATHGTGW